MLKYRKQTYRKQTSSKSLLSKLINPPKKIPLNIFQCWHTLNLPPKMSENVDLLKKQNPEFVHYLYDDKMCREFIQSHFGEEIFYIFNKLKPGAYKADLWRYCVLYIHGGIYLDIKYKCTNRFKLIELTEQEYYVRDREYSLYNNPKKVGIYQAFLCSFPRNTHLFNCIQTIVYNVKHNLYNNNDLDVTGPHIFDSSLVKNTQLSFNGEAILYYNKEIMRIYDTYREEQNIYSKNEYYNKMWVQRNIYEYPILSPSRSIELTRTITKDLLGKDRTFFSSTPTLVEYNEDEFILIMRWINCNYNEDGSKQIIPNQYISLNSITILDSSFSVIKEEHFLKESIDETIQLHPGIGLEDIRLFKYDNGYYYNATLYDANRCNPSTSCNKVSIEPFELERTIVIPSFYDSSKIKRCEKNWSYVLYQEKLRMVYQWHPMQIGEIVENRLNLVETKDMPDYFKEARGTSAGYSIGTEIWFVLHKAQNYHDNGKIYYNYQHFFAVFDKEMKLLRYSELFKLGGCKVEFCLGLIVKEQEILLSYSLLDTRSFISFYDRCTVDQMKWYYN